MKYFVNTLLAAVLLISIVSCEKVKGKGDVISENRNVTGYSGISLSIDADVYYTPAENYSMQINAQDNILDVIETPVENGNVVIKYKNGKVIGPHDKVVVYINAPSLRSFIISGSGTLNCDSLWPVQSVDMDISGSGTLYIDDIRSHDLSCNISGSGSINAAGGVVDNEDLNISGSGNIFLLNVVSDTCYAKISGSGNMEVYVMKLLDATISGSGDIKYQGNPVVNAHISGSGNVHKY